MLTARLHGLPWRVKAEYYRALLELTWRLAWLQAFCRGRMA